MKNWKLLAAMVVLMAVGSAIASEYVNATEIPAYTRKIDVGAEWQEENCLQRSVCEGVGQTCQISFDHDGDPQTDPITVGLYESTCTTQLTRSIAP